VSFGFFLAVPQLALAPQFGPHLLAPTASDLIKHGAVNTVFASYHYDLNFLTIHGRSRYPGLNAWLRDGSKMNVKVPAGCLLLQAGKQFEWLTGGHVIAGFHEVVVTPETVAAIERRRCVAGFFDFYIFIHIFLPSYVVASAKNCKS
jgi:isopenicillin N synthase-like dioxygenase